LVATLRSTERVTSLAFNNDGRALYHNGDVLCLREIRTRKVIRKFNVAGSVPFVLSADGKRLAAFGGGGLPKDRGILLVWETASGQQLLSQQCHDGTVTTAAFSPDHRFIATGSVDRTVRLWRIEPTANPK
jgi:WD40 repeat protein